MSTTAASDQATDALAERLFTAAIDTMELAAVHVGGKLGLYRALADGGPATPPDLAARTATDERYVREWLEQQAVAGFLDVDDPSARASERRFSLPEAHRAVLVDEENLSYLAGVAQFTIAVLRPLDALIEAYRTGAGVPYEAYGADAVEGIAAANRPQFHHALAGWLRGIPEVDERLRASPPARVADIACGSGWSSIAIARAYPNVTVDALDVDAESIEAARANAEGAGLDDRVRPAVHDASDPDLGGRYDLITIFEALHDMNHPVEALRTARSSLEEGGSVVIADERVADRFTAPGDDVERLNYAFSVLHCLPVANLDEDSAATGTVIRPDTVREYATEAGFRQVDVLPIENDLWRFYRLLR
jgi:2-polyprenyl-3-methyl-5-hydroxy-6-metoxy-1,4-benzoquinol methylase